MMLKACLVTSLVIISSEHSLSQAWDFTYCRPWDYICRFKGKSKPTTTSTTTTSTTTMAPITAPPILHYEEPKTIYVSSQSVSDGRRGNYSWMYTTGQYSHSRIQVVFTYLELPYVYERCSFQVFDGQEKLNRLMLCGEDIRKALQKNTNMLYSILLLIYSLHTPYFTSDHILTLKSLLDTEIPFAAKLTTYSKGRPQCLTDGFYDLSIWDQGVAYIESPGFGGINYYPPFSSCTWNIRVPRNKRVVIRFLSMVMIADDGDVLEISERRSARELLYVKPWYNYYSKGNSVTVFFKSNRVQQDFGFFAAIQAVKRGRIEH